MVCRDEVGKREELVHKNKDRKSTSKSISFTKQVTFLKSVIADGTCLVYQHPA